MYELYNSGRFMPPSESSEYLAQCEVKPEILFNVRKHVPERDKVEVDLEFLHFVAKLDGYDFDVGALSSGDLSSLDYQPTVINTVAGAKGVSKYFQNRKVLSYDDRKILDLSFIWLTRHFGSYLDNSMVLNLSEALQCAALDKSPGALWRQYWKTKADMISDRHGLDIIEDYWDSLASTRAPDVIHGAHLKDELRIREKIINMSTRIFIAAPCEHTLAGVRLFHDMNSKLASAQGATFSRIGMNKYKLGWHKLQIAIDRFKNKESVDVKNFDGSIYAEILWRLAEFRYYRFARKFQTVDNLMRTYNYYWSLINSLIVLPDGCVVLKEDGMPSGVYTTSSDDTFVSFIYIVFSYLKNGGPPDYDLFMRNFYAGLYGDDDMFSYSDLIKSFVNGKLYAKTLYDTFGLTVTGYGLQEWDELSFLSHKFVERDGYYVPQLSRDRILCSQIVGSCDPEKSAERASAFRILSWPQPHLYDLFTKYLLHLMEKYDVPRSLLVIDQDILGLYLNYESSIGKSDTLNKIYDIITNLYKYDENSFTESKSEDSTGEEGSIGCREESSIGASSNAGRASSSSSS